VLHAIGRGVSGMLRDRPAVLPGQLRQQPTHEGSCSPPGFDPSEPAGDPPQQLGEGGLPVGGVYAVAGGHRLIFGCLHSTG
jgi:hypothetical protein